MTKLRPINSVEDALVRISNQVPGGYETMAKVCPKHDGSETVSGTLVRAWGDPARRERMPVDAIIPLDILYQEHGGVGAPFFELLEYQRDATRANRFALERELAVCSAEIAKEAGDAIAALIEASIPGAGPEAKARARKEVAELDAAISRVAPQLSQEAPP